MNALFASGRAQATFLVLLVAVAAGAGLWLGQRSFGPPAAPEFQSELRLFPEPRQITDFHLEAPDGSRFDRSRWLGQQNLVFFGFTHCPDICPQTLAVLRDVEQGLTTTGVTMPQVTFVSVDPERDRGEALGTYTHYFSPRFLSATGDQAQLLALARQMGVMFQRVDLSDDNYTMDHGGSIILVDDSGRLLGLIRPPHDAAAIAADLITLFGS